MADSKSMRPSGARWFLVIAICVALGALAGRWLDATGASAPVRLVPTPGVVMAPPHRVRHTVERAPSGALEVVATFPLEEALWEASRALISVIHRAPRAFAIGDVLPDGSILTAIRPSHIEVYTPEDRIERWPVRDGSRGLAARTLVEAFESSSPLAQTGPAGPLPDDLVRIVFETLALLRSGDVEASQMAFDALMDAGEPIVPVLLRRVDSLERLPGVPITLPDGRQWTPVWEGLVVQVVLQSITGHRFGDPLAERIDERRALEAARKWELFLGASG
ncbi:MAG: hypothetical protein ACFB9M_17030 [Myxococcota bacterium]